MNFQLLSSIVLTIIFVISAGSISSSYASEPCNIPPALDIWMSYDDIYTGKVVSISTQTDYVEDNYNKLEWQIKDDTRIDFELEHLLKGNPQTTWHINVPLETYCPGDFCIWGADHYTLGSEIFYIENYNGNGSFLDGACGGGVVKSESYLALEHFDYYEKINGEPIQTECFRCIYQTDNYSNLRGEPVLVFSSSVEKLLERGYLVWRD